MPPSPSDPNAPAFSFLQLDFVPGIEPVYFEFSAAVSWANKAQTGAVVTPLEHNSACVLLATSMDAMADPSTVLARANIASNQYAAVLYQGSEAAFRGRTIPAAGIFPPPSDDATRLTWWQALAECAERLGVEYSANPTSNPDIALPDTARLIYVAGIAATAVLPLRFVKPGIAIKENPATAAATLAMLQGVATQNTRMAGRLAGLTVTLATAADPDVYQWETAQKIAQIYREESGSERKGIYWGIGITYGVLAATKLLYR